MLHHSHFLPNAILLNNRLKLTELLLQMLAEGTDSSYEQEEMMTAINYS
jgi:hypothetical protein